MGFRTVRIIFVSTLFLSVLAVSCKKESFNTGAGVTFSMSNKGADTKAEYRKNGIVDGKQMIDWAKGDGIAICCYCPDAESPVSEKQGPVTYSVASVSTENHQSIAKVGALSDGLKWGGDHNHKFYCVYPAVGDGTVTTSFGFENNNCVVKGTIPETQPQQEDLKPYMLMYGKAESQPEPKVDVDFYPLTTCIDFTISFDVPMTVTDIALVSSDGKTKLSGSFSYNLDSKECTTTDGADKVKVSYGDGKYCPKETTLSFKLFANPCDDIVEPYFAVNYFDEKGVPCFTKTQLKYKEEGERFKFVKSHKTNVTGLLVKEGLIITSFDEPTLLKWNEESNDLYLDDELEYVTDIETISLPDQKIDNDGNTHEYSFKVKSFERYKRSGIFVRSVKPSVVSDNTTVVPDSNISIIDENNDGEWDITLTVTTNSPDITEKAGYDLALTNAEYNYPKLECYHPKDGTYDESYTETANCYVVKAPGTYSFPATIKGNGEKYDSENPGTLSLSNPTASIVWQDGDAQVESVAYSNNRIQFTINKNKIHPGNAVIAVKDGSTIKWSWHIWITARSLVPSSGFMPVALGEIYDCKVITTTYKERECQIKISCKDRSKEFRLIQENKSSKTSSTGTSKSCTYYQWGRKDPLYDSNEILKGYISYSIDQAIQNPGKIMVPNSQAHWCSSNDLGLWGCWNNRGSFDFKKTIFDPSPVGYIVPSHSKLQTYINNGGTVVGFGSIYGSSVSSGNAYYWCSTPGGTSPLSINVEVAWCYRDNKVDYNINDKYYRKQAFSVLCAVE